MPPVHVPGGPRPCGAACLYTGALLLASLSWMEISPADEVHLFRSLQADRTRVYQGPPGSGGGHPLVCRLGERRDPGRSFRPGRRIPTGGFYRPDPVMEGFTGPSPRVLVDSDGQRGEPGAWACSGTAPCCWATRPSVSFEASRRPPARYLAYQVMRSTDHGRSWSSPVKIPDDPDRALASYSSIIQLPDGTVLMPLYAYVEGEEGEAGQLSSPKHFSYLYRSRDGGRSWGNRSLIAAGFNETNLVRLESGKLLAVMREERQTPRTQRPGRIDRRGPPLEPAALRHRSQPASGQPSADARRHRRSEPRGAPPTLWRPSAPEP